MKLARFFDKAGWPVGTPLTVIPPCCSRLALCRDANAWPASASGKPGAALQADKEAGYARY